MSFLKFKKLASFGSSSAASDTTSQHTNRVSSGAENSQTSLTPRTSTKSTTSQRSNALSNHVSKPNGRTLVRQDSDSTLQGGATTGGAGSDEVSLADSSVSSAAGGAESLPEMGIKNVDIIDADVMIQTVEIRKRPGQTLGFYIREGNGMDRGDGVFLSRIASGSVVEQNGLLKVGDEILCVNCVVVGSMRLDDVVVLMSVAKKLVLTIRTDRRYRNHPQLVGKIQPVQPSPIVRSRANVPAPKPGPQPFVDVFARRQQQQQQQRLEPSPQQGMVANHVGAATHSDGGRHNNTKQEKPSRQRRRDRGAGSGTASACEGGAPPGPGAALTAGGRKPNNPNRRSRGDPLSDSELAQPRPDASLATVSPGGGAPHQAAASVMNGPTNAPPTSRGVYYVAGPQCAGAVPIEHRRRVENPVPLGNSYSSSAVSSQAMLMHQGAGSTVTLPHPKSAYTGLRPELSTPRVGRRIVNIPAASSAAAVDMSDAKRATAGASVHYTSFTPRQMPFAADPTAAAAATALNSRQKVPQAHMLPSPHYGQPSPFGAGAGRRMQTSGHRQRPLSANSGRVSGASSDSELSYGDDCGSGYLSSSFDGAPSTSDQVLRTGPGGQMTLDLDAAQLMHWTHQMSGLTQRLDHEYTADGQPLRPPLTAPNTDIFSSSDYWSWLHDDSSPHLSAFRANAPPRADSVHSEPTRSTVPVNNPRRSLEPSPVAQKKFPHFNANDTADFLMYRPKADITDSVSRFGQGLTGVLTVHVIRGQGFSNFYFPGLTWSRGLLKDLYCLLQINGAPKARTAVKSGAVNFIWDERLQVDLENDQQVSLLVFKWSPRGSRHQLCFHQTLDLLHLFHTRRLDNIVSLSIGLEPRGLMFVRLYFENVHLTTGTRASRPFPSAVVANHAATAVDGPKNPVLHESRGIFGLSLDELASRDQQDIPEFLETAVREINARGLDVVGIYRVAGNLRRKADIRRHVEEEPDSVNFDAVDVHVISGLVKDFLRDLPEPLLTTDLVRGILENNAEALSSISAPLSKTIRFLINHFVQICDHADKNKMVAHNLATCLTPTCFHCCLDGGASLDEFKQALDLLALLFDSWKNLSFANSDEPSSSSDVTPLQSR